MTIEELKKQCPIIFDTKDLYPSRKSAILAQVKFFKTHQFILESLSEMQAKVLRLRYGIDDDKLLTFRKIAGHLGVTPARVQQVEEQAFSHLRRPTRMNWLMNYTDETFDRSLLDDVVPNFDSLIRKDIVRTIREDTIEVLKNVSIDELNIKIGRMENKVNDLKNKLKNTGINTCADLIKYLQTHSDLKELGVGYNSYSSCILALCDLIDEGMVKINSEKIMADYETHTKAKNRRLLKEESERLEAKARVEERILKEKLAREERLRNAITHPENVRIEDLNLSVRSYNALTACEIKTLRDLLDYCCNNVGKLMTIKNFGSICMQEISIKLRELGLLNENMSLVPSNRLGNALENPNKVILEDLGLSTRSYHYLKEWGINTLEDLIEFNNANNGQFCRIDNLGRTSEREILTRLQEMGVEVNIEQLELKVK